MKKPSLLILVFGILFLFIIQSAGTLIESIYILDLMNTRLDVKALGVLFFFTPLLLIPVYKKAPRPLLWLLLGLLVISRGLFPALNTASRLTVSGLAVGASLSLLFLLLSLYPQVRRWGAPGLALAVGLSTLLRAAGEGLELSLLPEGAWVGSVLGLLLAGLLVFSKLESSPVGLEDSGPVTAPIFGLYLVLALVYFSFSAPAVIARWTEGNYTLIVGAVSLFSLASAWLLVRQPPLLQRLSQGGLVLWNLLFTLSLTMTLLVHRVAFPPTAGSPVVVVGSPTWMQHVHLGLMLLFFPVLFVDLHVFLQRLASPASGSNKRAPGAPATGSLLAGILLGTFSLILLIFVNIFSNVWGYIKPISPPFRNTFWLAYFLLALGISLLVRFLPRRKHLFEPAAGGPFPWVGVVLLAAVFLATVFFALPAARLPAGEAAGTSLRVMTFNTQQSNDQNAERSYAAQLALIRRVSPDVLAMQETDSTRISLNNNDYVHYFAEKLGYYSYYGPKTVTGTYGTAILSKYPLLYPRSVFVFSDKDETGIAEAEIDVGGMRFTIFNVHPDSSDAAMLAFAGALVERASLQPNAIALGDYNLRDYERAYQVIDGHFTNAWVSVYPSEISPDGVDMSGDNRIDHIFLSPHLQALNPTYLLPPASATDHAVHWTDVVWSAP